MWHHLLGVSCCSGTFLGHETLNSLEWELSSWETPPFDVRAGLQQHRQSCRARALITGKLLHCS